LQLAPDSAIPFTWDRFNIHILGESCVSEMLRCRNRSEEVGVKIKENATKDTPDSINVHGKRAPQASERRTLLSLCTSAGVYLNNALL
jgi:hypothetical protein